MARTNASDTPTLKQDVQMILEAIESVKGQIELAESNEDKVELIGDLFALENCLVTQVTKFLKDGI